MTLVSVPISSPPTQMDFENFEYPDSPTQKWLADNADLSPLTVLDNINLKTEFPCAPGAGQVRNRSGARNSSMYSHDIRFDHEKQHSQQTEMMLDK